jgi:hypothetical protein
MDIEKLITEMLEDQQYSYRGSWVRIAREKIAEIIRGTIQKAGTEMTRDNWIWLEWYFVCKSDYAMSDTAESLADEYVGKCRLAQQQRTQQQEVQQ